MPIRQPGPTAQEGGVGLKGGGPSVPAYTYRDNQFIHKDQKQGKRN